HLRGRFESEPGRVPRVPPELGRRLEALLQDGSGPGQGKESHPAGLQDRHVARQPARQLAPVGRVGRTPVTSGAKPAPRAASGAGRNLLRGWRMGLPSGQAVARALGVSVVPDDKLRVGKANEDDTRTNPRLVDLSPAFADNAPLWYYILAESQQVFRDNQTPIRLGPVGGRIVGEVFVGLLWGDPHSFLKQDPTWKPRPEFLNKDGKFKMAELITQAMQV